MTRIPHILVIEDEPAIALALYSALTRSGYRVHTAKTGSSGLKKALAQAYDMILLDLGLPDAAGLFVCSQLRANNIRVPIIILTAESGVKQKVKLLDAGANDYLTKPFSVDELLARIRSWIRMPEAPRPSIYKLGSLKLDLDSCQVERDGIVISLRRKEAMLLACLMDERGAVVSRDKLLDYAWNTDMTGWTNTVDVHIKYLRDKLDRPFDHKIITTVHGVGYRLVVPATRRLNEAAT